MEFSRGVWTRDILFGGHTNTETVKLKTYLPSSRESMTMGKSSRIIFWEITMAKEMEEGSEKQEES